MKKALAIAAAAIALVAFKTLPQHLKAATPDELLYQGFRDVEVASVSDAMKLLYGRKMYMSHDMRPLFTTKFAGPASTVLLQKEEHTEGSKALAGMMDAIDEAPAGAVYVMVLQDGLDYAGWGGLMSTALKYRGMAGAIVDGGIRNTPQITKLQFPVFSRGIVPSTTVNHFRVSGKNLPVTCAGVAVRAMDILSWPTWMAWWWFRENMPPKY